MAIQFSCADFTFPLLPHKKALALIRMLNFNYADIGFFQGRSHIQPADVFADIKSAALSLQEDLSRNNLKVADLFLQLASDFFSRSVNNPESKVRKEVREDFRRTLEFAKNIGTSHVTILPGVHFPEENISSSRSRAVDELNWRVGQAQKAGIALGIEAHIGSICETPDAAESLLNQVSGLTLTLDYTHFVKKSISEDTIESLLPYASHFHVRGANGDRAQVKMSENTIDFPRFMAKLKASSYTGFITHEYVYDNWEHMDEVDTLSETIILRNLLTGYL